MGIIRHNELLREHNQHLSSKVSQIQQELGVRNGKLIKPQPKFVGLDGGNVLIGCRDVSAVVTKAAYLRAYDQSEGSLQAQLITILSLLTLKKMHLVRNGFAFRNRISFRHLEDKTEKSASEISTTCQARPTKSYRQAPPPKTSRQSTEDWLQRCKRCCQLVTKAAYLQAYNQSEGPRDFLVRLMPLVLS